MTMTFTRRSCRAALPLMVGFGFVVAPAMHGRADAVYTVTTNADAAAVPSDCAGNNPCTLRDAISLADIAGGTNTIAFADTVTAPIVLTQGTLAVAGEALTITGNGAAVTVVDGNAASTVFSVAAGASLSMSGATVRNGSATSAADGGGFSNAGTLTLTGVAVTGNAATSQDGQCPGPSCFGDSGGGIASSGTLTLVNATVDQNTSTDFGGGILLTGGSATVTASSFAANSAVNGAGIEDHFGAGPLSVTQSLFEGNVASGWGGGANVFGTASITNTTFTANTAGMPGGHAGIGAAVLVESNTGNATLVNDTVVGNHELNTATGPGSGGGGGIATGGGVVTVTNTLVAANTPTNCWTDGGSVSSAGNNDDSDGSCGFAATGDRHDADPGVDTTLHDNGGPTMSLALLPGSPAIDAADDTACAGGAGGVDQRGVTRPQGAHCDIGAFESSASTTTVTATQSSAGAPVVLAVTVAGSGEAAGAAAGSVDITKNGVDLGSVQLSPGTPSHASMTLSLADASDPLFAATYTPTNGFLASAGSVSFTPTAAPPTTPTPTPAPTPTSTVPVPQTGGGPMPGGAGTVLVILGTAVFVAGRRRPRSQSRIS